MLTRLQTQNKQRKYKIIFTNKDLLNFQLKKNLSESILMFIRAAIKTKVLISSHVPTFFLRRITTS